MTEQSEAMVIDPQDDDDDTLLDTCVLDACCVDWVACEFCAVVLLSSSSGSLGFSGLPGVSGSFGSSPEPAPPISPPPPGGQKGQMHDGRLMPKPPVPPFHLSTVVSFTTISNRHVSYGRSSHHLPPGPTMIIAAGMVNFEPSLFVSVTAVVTVLTAVIVAKSGKVAMAYGIVRPPAITVVCDWAVLAKASVTEA